MAFFKKKKEESDMIFCGRTIIKKISYIEALDLPDEWIWEIVNHQEGSKFQDCGRLKNLKSKEKYFEFVIHLDGTIECQYGLSNDNARWQYTNHTSLDSFMQEAELWILKTIFGREVN